MLPENKTLTDLLLEEERIAAQRLQEARRRREQHERYQKRERRERHKEADANAAYGGHATFYAMWLRQTGHSPEEAKRLVLERYPAAAKFLQSD